jgi:hypothetical protein
MGHSKGWIGYDLGYGSFEKVYQWAHDGLDRFAPYFVDFLQTKSGSELDQLADLMDKIEVGSCRFDAPSYIG